MDKISQYTCPQNSHKGQLLTIEHLLPPVSDLLQGFVCVCAQVRCSVVSN
jgi:hypothetical protein